MTSIPRIPHVMRLILVEYLIRHISAYPNRSLPHTERALVRIYRCICRKTYRLMRSTNQVKIYITRVCAARERLFDNFHPAYSPALPFAVVQFEVALREHKNYFCSINKQYDHTTGTRYLKRYRNTHRNLLFRWVTPRASLPSIIFCRASSSTHTIQVTQSIVRRQHCIIP